MFDITNGSTRIRVVVHLPARPIVRAGIAMVEPLLCRDVPRLMQPCMPGSLMRAISSLGAARAPLIRLGFQRFKHNSVPESLSSSHVTLCTWRAWTPARHCEHASAYIEKTVRHEYHAISCCRHVRPRWQDAFWAHLDLVVCEAVTSLPLHLIR
jgi:hypothetical protein